MDNIFDKQSAKVEKKEPNILDQYNAKSRKPTVEETHIRTTFLIDRELLAEVDKLAQGKHGFKTMFYNEAVRKLLQELR